MAFEVFSPLLASEKGLPSFPSFYEIFLYFVGLEKWAHYLLKWEDIFFSVFVAVLISLVFVIGAKKRELIPYGFQNFLEWTVENFYKFVQGILGSETEEHFPFLASLFLYILVMNSISAIPFMKSPTSNLSITAGMAMVVFAKVQYLNFRNMGVKGYFYSLCGSPKGTIPWLLSPLLFFIELLTQFTRPVTLALRLTGNVMGEHILVSIFTLFALAIFTFNKLPFGLPVQLPAMIFGLLMGIIQALVFTLLATIYIYLSTEHEQETH